MVTGRDYNLRYKHLHFLESGMTARCKHTAGSNNLVGSWRLPSDAQFSAQGEGSAARHSFAFNIVSDARITAPLFQEQKPDLFQTTLR